MEKINRPALFLALTLSAGPAAGQVAEHSPAVPVVPMVPGSMNLSPAAWEPVA